MCGEFFNEYSWILRNDFYFTFLDEKIIEGADIGKVIIVGACALAIIDYGL